MLLLTLPLVLLALGFLLGIARLYRTLIFFVCWVTLCAGLYISSILYGFAQAEPKVILMGGAIAVLLVLPSIWFAMLFSFVSSPKTNPTPIKQAYDIYQTLDDSQKEKVQQVAKAGLGIFAKHASTYLRNKGYPASADALGETARRI